MEKNYLIDTRSGENTTNDEGEGFDGGGSAAAASHPSERDAVLGYE